MHVVGLVVSLSDRLWWLRKSETPVFGAAQNGSWGVPLSEGGINQREKAECGCIHTYPCSRLRCAALCCLVELSLQAAVARLLGSLAGVSSFCTQERKSRQSDDTS